MGVLKYLAYISIFWVLITYKAFNKPATDPAKKTKFDRFFSNEISYANYDASMEEMKSRDPLTYWLMIIGPALMTIGLIFIALSLPSMFGVKL